MYEIVEKEKNGKKYKVVLWNGKQLKSHSQIVRPLYRLLYKDKNIPQKVLDITAQKGNEIEAGIETFLKTKNVGQTIWNSKVPATQQHLKSLAFWINYRKDWEFISRNDLVYKDKLMAQLDFVIKDDKLGEINLEVKTNKDNPLIRIIFGIQSKIQEFCSGRPTWVFWVKSQKDSSKPEISMKQYQNHPIINDIFLYLLNYEENNQTIEDLRDFLFEVDNAYDQILTKEHGAIILWNQSKK